jgi:hypothetical protein
MSDLAIKTPVRVATTANIALSGLQTVDSVSLAADDRVLVKDQSSGVGNGIYVAASGSWTRATDFAVSTDVVNGTMVWVNSGATNGNTQWQLSNTNPITIGSTNLTFALAAVPIDGNRNAVPFTSDGAALGTTVKQWSDLFLAQDASINWNNGDLTVTHSADTLMFSAGTYTFGNQSSLRITNQSESTGSDFLYLDGMSRGPGLGNYRTKFVRGNPGMVTNGYVAINGGTGEEPSWPDGDNAFMLGIVSDVDPQPAIVVSTAGGPWMRCHYGVSGDLTTTEAALTYDGARNGIGWHLYNHQSYISPANNQAGFMRWNTNAFEIGTESPNSTGRGLTIKVPVGASGSLMTLQGGYLNFNFQHIALDQNTRTLSLIAHDLAIGSALALRQNPDATYGFDFGISTSGGYLRLSAVNNSVHTPALGILRNNAFVGIGHIAPDRQLHVEADDVGNNTVTPLVRLTHTTSGMPGAGIGAGMEFEVECASVNRVGATIEAVTTDVTNGSEDFDLVFKTMAAGAAAAERARILSTGGLAATGRLTSTDAIRSSSPTAGIGYGAGAGGTVVQLSSITTGVTLNKVTGQITTVSATTAAGAEDIFTVTNAVIAATDVPVLATTYGGAGTPLVYCKKVAAGSFDIAIANLHASSALNAALVINFVVLKGATS